MYYLELHSCESDYLLSEVVLDDRQVSCCPTGLCAHGLSCQVVEGHNVVEHPNRLVEGTVTIVRCVRVLLQEVVLD